MKRKLNEPKLSKRKAKLANEDISSDEDDFLYNDNGRFVENQSEEEEYEDVQEVAYRKAKQLLDDIQVFQVFSKELDIIFTYVVLYMIYVNFNLQTCGLL